MTEQQMRFNEGKPKYSYFFASRTALEKLRDGCGTAGDSAELYYSEAVGHISSFLDGTYSALAAAARALCQGLQEDADGNAEEDFAVMTAEEFLSRSPAALDAYSAVCVYGEGKYARGNFRKGAPVTQYLDSALRHILARLRGELLDPESGKPHGGHALWNVVQALDQPSFRDDRLPPVKQLPSRPDCCPAIVPPPTPEPDTFDVVEAGLRMLRGKTVERIDVAPFTGRRLRCVAGAFEFLSEFGPEWRASSFPLDYETGKFVEVT